MSLPHALLIEFSSNVNFKRYILGDTWSRMHKKNYLDSILFTN